MRVGPYDVNFRISVIENKGMVPAASRLFLCDCFIGLFVSSLSAFSFIKRFRRPTEIAATATPIVG